jgi:hypothetical protein
MPAGVSGRAVATLCVACVRKRIAHCRRHVEGVQEEAQRGETQRPLDELQRQDPAPVLARRAQDSDALRHTAWLRAASSLDWGCLAAFGLPVGLDRPLGSLHPAAQHTDDSFFSRTRILTQELVDLDAHEEDDRGPCKERPRAREKR